MSKWLRLTQADEHDIVTLYQAGLGQSPIGHLYGCSFAPIRRVLIEAGEEIHGFPGRRPRALPLRLTRVQEDRINDLLREGASVQRIMDHVRCPVKALARCLSMSPWWVRCEGCRRRILDSDQSLWQYERDGLCGKCAREHPDP